MHCLSVTLHGLVYALESSTALEAWERRYNHERFSMALRGHTPGEMLATKLGAPGTDQLASTGA
jgi:hypothetical protein